MRRRVRDKADMRRMIEDSGHWRMSGDWRTGFDCGFDCTSTRSFIYFIFLYKGI